MTKLRQAAQAALDALESDAIQRTFAGGVRMSNAAIALRAALAQPPAPTAQPAESATGQPLSDAEIFLTLAPLFPEATRNTFLVSVARAVEAAHGIAAQKGEKL